MAWNGYDSNGNLTSDSNGTVITYNAADQSTSMQSNSSHTETTTYTGTSQAERVAVNNTTDLYSSLGLSRETNASGSTEYVRCSCGLLNSLHTPDGKKYYYLFDGEGSIVSVTDSSGNDVDRYSYDPFGTKDGTWQVQVNQPWTYAGGYYDSSTGLYKYGIRYYDSTTGHWTQATPIGGSLQEATKANPYVYADDNPANEVDESGALPDPTEIFVGIGVGAAFGAFGGLIDGLFLHHSGQELAKDVLCGAISGGIEGGITAAIGPLFDTAALAKVVGGPLAEKITSFVPWIVEHLSGGLCSVLI